MGGAWQRTDSVEVECSGNIWRLRREDIVAVTPMLPLYYEMGRRRGALYAWLEARQQADADPEEPPPHDPLSLGLTDAELTQMAERLAAHLEAVDVQRVSEPPEQLASLLRLRLRPVEVAGLWSAWVAAQMLGEAEKKVST